MWLRKGLRYCATADAGYLSSFSYVSQDVYQHYEEDCGTYVVLECFASLKTMKMLIEKARRSYYRSLLSLYDIRWILFQWDHLWSKSNDWWRSWKENIAWNFNWRSRRFVSVLLCEAVRAYASKCYGRWSLLPREQFVEKGWGSRCNCSYLIGEPGQHSLHFVLSTLVVTASRLKQILSNKGVRW